MKTLYELPLMEPGSSEGFKVIDLNAKNTVDAGLGSEWSVKSHTLRGGLQEGVDVVEINNGKLSFAVLPTRGMGLWKGQCGDISLGWDSPVKDPVNPAFINNSEGGGIGWLKGFNEWIVRCGLSSMGAPCQDMLLDSKGHETRIPLTLHGNIANIPARSVTIEITDKAIILRGEVDETMMLGPALRLNSEIRTEFGSGRLTIRDTVTNIGNKPTEHQLLYHINYGKSLLEKGSRMLAPFKQVAPRDLRAAEDMETFDKYGAPQIGFDEQVYLYELVGKEDSLETVAMLCNAAGNQASLLRYSLKDFPCFTQWKNTAGKEDGYVTGLEPATNYPNSRRFEREKGRVLTLAGGESRSTELAIETLDGFKAIREVEAEVKELQETVQAKVHRQPFAHFSGSSS